MFIFCFRLEYTNQIDYTDIASQYVLVWCVENRVHSDSRAKAMVAMTIVVSQTV